jgi:biopolymer transport protein ExbB
MQEIHVLVKALCRPRPFALALALLTAMAAAPAFAQAPSSAPATTAPAASVPMATPIAPPTQSSGPPAVSAPTPDASSTSAEPSRVSTSGGMPVVANAALPRDLSPWGMFLNADIVVKVVMVGLVFASLVTWTVWLAKNLELWRATRNGRKALAALNEARSLAEANVRLGASSEAVARLLRTAVNEVQASPHPDTESLKERISWLLERVEASAGRRIGRGMGLLATIGATAPFVGLFGTVWGIMNSFIGISNAQTTNLAVVAPGIAEALLATALGLFAAIPAVVIYNVFSRSIGGYRALLADGSALVMRLVSRDCERVSPLSRAAAE